jgi:hypothetical protein
MGAISTACAITIAAGVNSSPERAERPGARQQQVDQQPRHHRRQPHQGVQHDQQRLPAGEARHRQHRPQRQPDQRGQQRRGEGHAQRQPDDAPQRGVPRPDQPRGLVQRLAERRHRRAVEALTTWSTNARALPR